MKFGVEHSALVTNNLVFAVASNFVHAGNRYQIERQEVVGGGLKCATEHGLRTVVDYLARVLNLPEPKPVSAVRARGLRQAGDVLRIVMNETERRAQRQHLILKAIRIFLPKTQRLGPGRTVGLRGYE